MLGTDEGPGVVGAVVPGGAVQARLILDALRGGAEAARRLVAGDRHARRGAGSSGERGGGDEKDHEERHRREEQ